MSRNTELPGFYRRSADERLLQLQQQGILSAAEVDRLRAGEYLLTTELADKMIENVIGVFGLPFAIAPNFIVDGREVLVPMVVEEPSVVAGLSSAAKLARQGGGFRVEQGESLLIGQLHLVDFDDADSVMHALHSHEAELLRLANVIHPKLLARGGGVRGIETSRLQLADGTPAIALNLLVDTCDAMGANLVNTICEGIAPRVEALTGGRVLMKILSNLASRSVVTASVTLPLEVLGDRDFAADFVRDAVVQATAVAHADPYRAATHNKGIMNGIDAVAIATGNDWRAIEAGAHAYAVRNGRYRSLSDWSVDDNGDLHGRLRLPLKVGTVGGSLTTNPAVRLGLQIADAGSARELAAMMAAVGLAQNFAALRALVTHGIQKGHMSLHARSVVAGAGASPEIFNEAVKRLLASGEVKSWKAAEIIADINERDTVTGPRVAPDAASGSACGKVILLGEHAAVYDKHVLAVPLPDAVTATVCQADGPTRLRIPAWEFDEAIDLVHPGHGAAAVVALILRELVHGTIDFDIHVEPRIPVAMGLGASAALAVAIIRAVDAHRQLGLDNRAVNALAFECEKLAHGTPSGIDNNIATFGEPVLYTRSTAARTRPIRLAESPPLVIASSGQRGITRDMVAGVRERRARNEALYDTIFNEIDELSIAAAVALRDGVYEELGSMMNVCQGFLNAIGVSTPELEKMIHIARSHGALGAKLTGAGGGGSIVALCPGRSEVVADALNNAGYAIIRIH